MQFSISTALMGAMLSSFVLTGAMFYLSLRKFATAALRWWTLGFLFLFSAYVFMLADLQLKNQAAGFLGELCHTLFAIFVFVGAMRLSGRRLSYFLIGILIFSVLVWNVIGTVFNLDFFYWTAPLYFVSGALLIIASVSLMHRSVTRKRKSYILPAIGFFLWGIHKFDYPILRHSDWFPPYGFMISEFLALYLSIILMIMALNRQSERAINQTKRLQYFTEKDALTGIFNRRTLTTVVEKLIKNSNTVLLIAFLDLRNFHEINEGLGQKVGDKVLRLVAHRLTEMEQTNDITARVGGDEFAIVTQLPNEDYGQHTLPNRIRLCLETPLKINEHEIYVDATIGVAYYPRDGLSADEVLESAASALSDARLSGVRFRDFGELHSSDMRQRMNLRRDLHSGLIRNQFSLVYQPQIDLKTRTVYGVEALMRWNHPKYGNVSPAEFIPLAESSEFIIELGEWSLQKAISDIESLENDEFKLRLSVNLSAIQFKHAGLIDMAIRSLTNQKLKAEHIEFEITETTIVHDEQVVADIMSRLQDIGFRFAMDDFGTGYSSLSILKKLPFYLLKIDRTFITDLRLNTDAHSIVDAMIWMAHSLGLKVIAEGVETQDQLDILTNLNCDYVQGYFTGRPMKIQNLREFLLSQKTMTS